jgi:hypothetical protein
VCFMVLLLDAFPSGMRDPTLSKGCPALCKYATSRIRSPGCVHSKRRAAETRDHSRRFDRSNCIRSPPARQDLQDINLPPTRANGVVAS